MGNIFYNFRNSWSYFTYTSRFTIFVIAAFLFGFISEKQLIKGLKKFKIKDEKMAKWTNKLINHIIIRYIHKRKIAL